MSSIITKEKVIEIIRKIEKCDEVQIEDFKINDGTEIGENYTSELIKVDVEAKVNEVSKSYHWMVKLPNSDPGRKEINKSMKVDEKEAKVYSELLPNLKKMIADRNADIELNSAPCPHAEFNPEDDSSLIFMENLKLKGYAEAVNKKRGLDTHYVKKCLEGLAKFHACTYAYLRSYPGGLKQGLEENYFFCRDYVISDPIDEVKEFMENMQNAMKPIMDNYVTASADEGQDFKKALYEYAEKNGEGCVFKAKNNLVKPKDHEFNVIYHGDPWFNNVLFKHENEVATHAIWVDWAALRYGNPCNDLAYFSFLSINPEERKKHMKEYLEFYHQILVETLKKLNENPNVYSLSQLMEDYKKYSYYGYISCTMVTPGMLARKEDAITPADLQGDWNDKDELKKIMEGVTVKAKRAFANEPYMKVVLQGAFMEMVEYGHFKLYEK